MDKILEILDYVACNPDDYDGLKCAAEIREEVSRELNEDLVIADNMKDYWKHLNCGAEK